MKLKLVFAFILMIATTTFAQSDLEGIKQELALEKEAAVMVEEASTAIDQEEATIEVSKDKRLAFRETLKDLRRDLKETRKAVKNISKEDSKSKGMAEVGMLLLVILALLIPVIAVGLYTNWDTKLTVISLILMLLFWLPGIIFAFLVIFDVIG